MKKQKFKCNYTYISVIERTILDSSLGFPSRGKGMRVLKFVGPIKTKNDATFLASPFFIKVSGCIHLEERNRGSVCLAPKLGVRSEIGLGFRRSIYCYTLLSSFPRNKIEHKIFVKLSQVVIYHG